MKAKIIELEDEWNSILLEDVETKEKSYADLFECGHNELRVGDVISFDVNNNTPYRYKDDSIYEGKYLNFNYYLPSSIRKEY